MSGKKHDKALHLEMPFGEAIGRLAQVDPQELPPMKKTMNKKTKTLKRLLSSSPPINQDKQTGG